MKKMTNSKGFTLAEMLIVMAVVVILAAATLPTIAGQTEAAKQSNDLAALREGYIQAYTEAAMQVAADATTVTTTPVSINFQQSDGDFGKLGNTVKIADKAVSACTLATSKAAKTGSAVSVEYSFTVTSGKLSLSDIKVASA